jgi:osmotically-inducible protein OsmY
MSFISKKLLVAILIVVIYSPSGFLLASEHDKPAAGFENTWQEAQIWTTYKISPYLRKSNIEITVKDGIVTLHGIVSEDVDKELAEAIASGVTGVRSVDNFIRVDHNYQHPVADAERGFAEMVDDASITAAIKSKILWSKMSDGMATEVDTYLGKVTLAGEVSDEESMKMLERLAKNTNGVVSVDSQLNVVNRPAREVIQEDGGAKETHLLQDGWITTKVKSTYMYSSNIDSDDISVNTTNGIVSLEGIVKTGQERALAIELAKNIRGVKSVVATKLSLK